MTTATTEPTAWVGCLACYNAGRLVGDWHPAITAGDVTAEDLHGRATSHDELWVMDHDGLPIRGECSPARAQQIAEHLAEVDDWQRDAFRAWWASGDYVADGDDLPILEDFEERYAGEWDSFREYAENLADDIGLTASLPDEIAAYFNWQAWTNDLAYDYVTRPAPRGGVFVFRSL